MADDQDNQSEQGASSPPGISFEVQGRTVRMRSAAKWRRAIEIGDLQPDTLVEVDLAGDETKIYKAADLEALKPLFEAAGFRLQTPVAPPAGLSPPVEPPSQPESPDPEDHWSEENDEPAHVLPPPIADDQQPTPPLSPPDNSDAINQNGPPSRRLKAIAGIAVIVIIGLIGAGSVLLRGPRAQDTPPVEEFPNKADAPVPLPSIPERSDTQALASLANNKATPKAQSTVTATILSGRVKTSILNDAGPSPSFTAKLSARYANVGPNDKIAASLWKGGIKVLDCEGGTPSVVPAGSFSCELSQLALGTYEFRVGFVGQRTSIYRFKLTPRGTPGPSAEQMAQVASPPAPTAPPGNLSFENPTWDRKPSGDDVARYYPDRALRQEVDGRATISCSVKANGTVTGCVVVSESPEGYGFGDAAIKLSSRFRMKPKRVDGSPVEGGTVRIPIVFRAPEG